MTLFMVELSSASKTRNAISQLNDGSLGESRQVHLAPVLNIIDRYIAKMFLGYLAAGLVVFVTMFLAVDAISSASRFDAASSILIHYYTLKLSHCFQIDFAVVIVRARIEYKQANVAPNLSCREADTI